MKARLKIRERAFDESPGGLTLPSFYLPLRLRLQGGGIQRPFQQHPWVYSAIKAKSTALSSVPLKVYTAGAKSQDDAPTYAGDDHPLQKILFSPNPVMTGNELKEGISIYLDLYGEAMLLLVNENNGGYVPEKPPASIWFIPNPRGLAAEMEGSLIKGWTGTTAAGKKVAYKAEQIVRFREFSPYDPIRGLARIDPLEQGVSLDYKAGQFSTAFFDNGADPGGVLTTDLDLTPDQKKQVRAEWERRHQGAINRGRVAVLEGGLKYVPIEVSHEKMQFLGQREWTREEILAVYGVPKMLVGLIDDVNRATGETTLRMFWENTILPRATHIEDVFWSAIFEKFNALAPTLGRVFWVQFDTSNVEALRGNMTEKIAQAEGLKKLGYPINMINRKLDLRMEEVEWGDEPLENPNQVPVTLLHDDPGGFINAEAPPDAKRAQSFLDRGFAARRRRAQEDYAREFFHPAEKTVLVAIRTYFSKMRIAQVNAVLQWGKSRPKGLPPLTTAEIESFLIGPKKWGKTMEGLGEDALATVGAAALKQLAKELGGFHVIPPNFDTPWVRQTVARRVAQLVRLSEKDRILLRRVLLKQFGKTGPSDIRALASSVNKWFGGQKAVRALRIARTESAMLSNALRFRGMRDEGIEKQEWVSAGDDAVRETEEANHVEMDGEVVKMGKKFSNGLFYPTQPGAPAAQVVNCRCRAVAKIEV